MEKVNSFKMNKIYLVEKDFIYDLFCVRKIEIKKGERVRFTGKLMGADGRFERVPMKQINGRHEGSFIVKHKEMFKIFGELNREYKNG